MAIQRREEQLNGMPISDTSIRQPVFVTMLMLLTIVFGVLAFRSLPVNLLPDFEVPIIAISVPYPAPSRKRRRSSRQTDRRRGQYY